MMKDSPEGYNAENGFSEPAQKPQTGEPYERKPLYRIRRPQEKHQLLRENGRRNHPRRRQTAAEAPDPARVGEQTHRALARGYGSDAVQRLDLRHVETVCRRVTDGTSGDDESHRRVEEEERQAGRAENRRPGTLQSASGMLRGAGGTARIAAAAALPQPGGGPSRVDEEQDERAVDGSRRRVQQEAATRGKVFCGIAGPSGRSAGIGEGSATAEPWRSGDGPGHPATVAGQAGEGSAIGGAGEAAEEHSGGGRGHGIDVGAGGGRAAPVLLGGACSELLRADFCVGFIGRQATAGADLEAAQRSFANGADRGGKVGAAVEPATGSDPRAGSRTRPPQPGDLGGGTQTGGLKSLIPGLTDVPPFPAPSIKGNRSRWSRVRFAAPNCGAPLTTGSCSQEKLLRRGKGRPWDICRTRRCPTARRFVSDPPAAPRLGGTARRRFSSRCA